MLITFGYKKSVLFRWVAPLIYKFIITNELIEKHLILISFGSNVNVFISIECSLVVEKKPN